MRGGAGDVARIVVDRDVRRPAAHPLLDVIEGAVNVVFGSRLREGDEWVAGVLVN